MSPTTDQGLVSPSDIADIAGVTRGAVSNWRRRSKDFPQPVAGTPTKPLFSRQEVTDWLTAHKEAPKRDDAQTAVWAAMNLLRGQLSVDQASELVLSLLLARAKGSSAEGEWDQVPQELRAQVREIIDRINTDGLGSVADFALERLGKSLGKAGGQFGFIGSPASMILATLAVSRPGGVLYDPACGIGAALLEAVDRGAKPDRIIGHDIDQRALHIAAQRAELHQVPVELVHTDVLAGDVDPSLRADVVILEPPFGLRFEAPSRLLDARFEFGTPPRASADTAWLQHVVAHLSETGRGYVLTPWATLARGGEEAKIRAELLRRGCVEAVVGLPGKLLLHTAIPLALWVLRRPDPTGGQVLVIDASETDAPEDHIAAWLSDPATRQDVPHAMVPLTDVLAAESVLTPPRWVDRTQHDAGELAAAYAHGWAGIHDTMRQLQDLEADFQNLPALSRSRVMTVRELIEEGVLDLAAGRPKEHYRNAPLKLRNRILTATDLIKGRLQEAGLEDAYPDYPELTHKGDLLLATTPTLHAIVDEVGGHLPSTSVSRLRVLSPDVLAPSYLATAITGTWNRRFQTGTGLPRTAIRDLEIPLIPPTDQTTIQQAVTSLRRLQQAATRLADNAATTSAALLEAVRYNAPLTSPAADSVAGTRQDEPHRSKDPK